MELAARGHRACARSKSVFAVSSRELLWWCAPIMAVRCQLGSFTSFTCSMTCGAIFRRALGNRRADGRCNPSSSSAPGATKQRTL